MEGKGDKATAEGMELLRKEVDKMKEELKTSEDGLYTFPRKNICSGSALEAKWCDRCRGLRVLLKIIWICVLSSLEKLPVGGRRNEEANGGAHQGVRQTAEGTSGAPGNVDSHTKQDRHFVGSRTTLLSEFFRCQDSWGVAPSCSFKKVYKYMQQQWTI